MQKVKMHWIPAEDTVEVLRTTKRRAFIRTAPFGDEFWVERSELCPLEEVEDNPPAFTCGILS